jgi:hypothetical protein
MDAILLELARQLPSAFAIAAVVYMFLKYDERKDQRRETNARELSAERREHDKAKDTIWAGSINQIVSKQEEMFKLIANAISFHEEQSEERYKRIQVTQDLIKMAKAKAKDAN